MGPMHWTRMDPGAISAAACHLVSRFLSGRNQLMRETVESLNEKSLFALGGDEGFWVGEPEKPGCQYSWIRCWGMH